MRADVLVVSLGTTSGWRAAAHELAGALARAGAHVVLVIAGPVPRVRTYALTDLLEAQPARLHPDARREGPERARGQQR